MRERDRKIALVVCALVWSSAPDVAAAGKRLVSLAPSITETLFAIGAGAELVGVTDLSDWPPEASRIDRVGSYLTPNVEAVVAHRPDLVIAVPSPGNREAVESLESLGLRIVMVEEGPTIADVFASIDKIAAAVDRPAEGKDLVGRLRERIEHVEKRAAALPRRRVLLVVGQNPL
ncbi:MAG: helical backbone metal receptor, partial [Candidatus Binatia bacterium]